MIISPAVLIPMMLAVLLLTWWEIRREVKGKPRPWWEAPPFPLENKDRLANWLRRRAQRDRARWRF